MNSMKVRVGLYKLNVAEFKKSGKIIFFNKNKTDNDDVSILDARYTFATI